MGADRLQQWLLRAGLVISAVLLVRFAIDFSEEMKWWLAGPFWLLVIAALGVGASNIFRAETHDAAREPRSKERALLLAAIPLGLLASSLDCTGLSARGCSAFCTFIKLVWIPLIALVCVGYFLTRGRVWLTIIAAMSFAPLFPHCVCYNVGNAWWIDRIGSSPVCYVWGLVVGVLAVGALRRAATLRFSLIVCYTIIAGAEAFFVSHHYFRFPW